MYAWIWRRLPGPVLVRALLAGALTVAVIAVCFVWVFPAVAPYVPFNNNTVGE